MTPERYKELRAAADSTQYCAYEGADPDDLAEALDEIKKMYAAFCAIERLYYTEAKDTSWRAAQMRAIAQSQLEGALDD